MHFRSDPSGASPLAAGEFRVLCALCGSPYVCQTDVGDPKYAGGAAPVVTDARRLLDPKTVEARPFVLEIEHAIPDFQCTAGDCGYVGPARRS